MELSIEGVALYDTPPKGGRKECHVYGKETLLTEPVVIRFLARPGG